MPIDAPALWLVVENDESDAFLMRRALERVTNRVLLYRVQDGVEAKAYLSGAGHFQDRAVFPLPRLILSDLKMPMINGLELLAWIRSEPALARLPFILLTSSNHPVDRERACSLAVDDYLVKPHHFHDLQSLVQSLTDRF